MPNGINKVTLIGFVGHDPELRFMQSGDAVTNCTIATSESWKDKITGENVEKTEWHRVVFFRRLAEIVGEYVKKGARVYIEGKLQTRKWQDKNGNDRYTTEVVANEMQMLDSRGAAIASPAANSPQHNQPAMQQPNNGEIEFDDQIPF